MISGMPTDVQAYAIALFFGVAAPMVVFWMLHLPLRHFLSEIFRSPPVEQFWLRLVIVVLVCAGLSAAVGFRPDVAVAANFVALIWNLADEFRSILDNILYSMFALFLPLLLAYTILHAGRFRAAPTAPAAVAERKEP